VAVSPTSLSIRRAVLDDAPAIRALSVAAIRRSAATHYSETQRSAWAARRTVEAHRRMIERTVLLVALDGEEIVGFAGVAVEPGVGLVRGEVDQLFVHPDHGGRGVARLLLAAIDSTALAAGIGELITHASWRAAPVFERCGYRRLAEETVRLDDQVLTRVRMARSLCR